MTSRRKKHVPEIKKKVLQLPTNKWQPKTFQLPQTAKRFRSQPTPGVMNKTEARYASYLEQLRHLGTVVDWLYEPVSIKLAINTHYKPDFIVILADGSMEVIDVKGSNKNIQDDSLAKIKIVADLWWFAVVKIVMPSKNGGWSCRVFESTRWIAHSMEGISHASGISTGQ